MRDVNQHMEIETSQLSNSYGQLDHLRELNAQNNGWANVVIFLIIYILACSVSAGTITGEVIDTLSGKPLAGTNVVIHGTDLGAVSDISGVFTIENVPVGEHRMRIIHIGYCLQTDVIKISRKKDLIHLT